MKNILIMLTVLCAARIAGAELFTFTLDGKHGASWDEVSSGVYTNVGTTFTLEASLYAYLDGVFSPGSILNSGSSDFGINAAESGDASLAFDTVNGQEAVWISFNQDVTIKSITVSSFAASGTVETGAYQVASGSLEEFSGSGLYGGIDAVLNQGDYFKVTTVDDGTGNGWSLDSFVVEAVPEPATLSLIGLAGVLCLLTRRIQRCGR